MEVVENNIPRRNRLDLLYSAEKHILDSVSEVEKLPADVRLTDAVILLQQAREKVADFIESEEGQKWRMANAIPA
jgi:hypothetical protein